MKLDKFVLAVSIALLLTACGGGSPSEAPAVEQPAGTAVPPSAAVSAASYAQYVGSLIATETGQPLDLGQFKPPTSETEEPVPVL